MGRTALFAMASTLVLSAMVAPEMASAQPIRPSDEAILAAYTLIVPKSVSASKLQARAVVSTGALCPSLTAVVAGKKNPLKKTRRTVDMTMRAPGASTTSAFAALRACTANLPLRALRASISGTRIPAALPAKTSTIATFGDTGCRVSAESVQACTDSAQWPLAQISQSIAAKRPDVIFFLGDFFYREAACPDTSLGLCGGSPAPLQGAAFKDTGDGWLADVFTPMKPVLTSAPILISRGNHEACNRGGNGYFLFFDTSSLGPAACAPDALGAAPKNIVPTTHVDLPIAHGRTLRAISVDSAYGLNSDLSDWIPTQRVAYERAQKLAQRTSTRDVWLVTHRPMFGRTSDLQRPDSSWSPWGSIDQTSAAYGLTSGYDLMLASHQHLAQAVRIPGQPVQMILGNGGTMLEDTDGYGIPEFGPMANGKGQALDPARPPLPQADYLWTDVRFGFALATPTAKRGSWKFTHFDPSGTQFAVCRISPAEPTRPLRCS